MAETTVDLPVEHAAIGSHLRVTMTLENPIAPCSLGMNDDPWLLGVQIHEVSLLATDPLPAQAPSGPQAPSSGPSAAVIGLKACIDAVVDRVRALIADGTRSIPRRLPGKAWLKQLIRQAARRLRAFMMADLTAQLDRSIEEQRGIGTRSEEKLTQVSQTVARISGRLSEPTVSLHEKHDLLAGQIATRLPRIEENLAQLSHRVVLLHQKSVVLSTRSLVNANENTVLVGTAVGHVLCPKSDLRLITALHEAGELEPGLRRTPSHLLAPGMAMVDAGAHFGLHTLAAAELVGPSGRVLAFETPSTFDLLGRGLALNELSERVTAYNTALGAEAGEVDLHLSPICGHNSIYPLPGDHPIVRVPLQRLDDMLPADSRVDVVKLDVEGAELDVLRGMARIDQNSGLIMLVEFGPSHLQRIGVSPSDWLEAFLALGFAGLALEEPSGACRPLADIDLGAVESVNIAFVRSDSALRAPLLG